jgi:preprotein translocase subunit SecE
VSDERDPDAAAEGGDEPGTGQTAAAGGPLRPTGKRSRQRTGGTALAELDDTDEALTEQFEAVDEDGKPKKAKKAKAAGSSRNPFVFVWNYLKQVVAELRKVIWPNRKQMVSYTAVVLAFLAFMTALISGVDLGLARLVLWVFGGG